MCVRLCISVAVGRPLELPTGYDWIEQYEVDTAQATVDRLLRHWTHSVGHSDPMHSGSPTETDSESDVSTRLPLHNEVCSHPVCSAMKDACFLSELNDVKRHYHGGGVTSFKIKAIDTAERYRSHIWVTHLNRRTSRPGCCCR